MELGILMVLGGFMETMSVSLIMPFMSAVMSPDSVMNNKYVQIILNIFGIESYRGFLFFLSILMAFIYIVKNLFLLFELNIQNKFVYNNMFHTQQSLLHSYLSRPYDYYLNIKSGEVLRVIGNDTASAFETLTILLQMFSELVVSVALIGTIFYVAPSATVAIAILMFGLVYVISVVIRPILSKAGIKNLKVTAEMNQWLLQSIQGIKEVKIMKKEQFFEKKFSYFGAEYARTSRQSKMLGMVPRFTIEAVSMSSFFFIVAFLIYDGMEVQRIVPALSAIAMAAIRLLPSVNRISQAIARMTFGESTIDKLIENLKEIDVFSRAAENDAASSADTERFDRIRKLDQEFGIYGITYKYPTGKKNVLKDADAIVKKGESIGIVGTSGAGKTTAVDIMLGLLKPSKGKVLVDGTDIELDRDGWLSQIGYIPQSIFMLDGSIRDNVAFGIAEDEIDDNKVWDALKEAAIDDDVRELPDGLDTQIGERGIRLSGGQKQRIGIARALYSNPSVLFFDEATSALDNETEAEIMDSINHLHGVKTMVIIAHRLTTIEECDHIFRVEDGRIVRDK